MSLRIPRSGNNAAFDPNRGTNTNDQVQQSEGSEDDLRTPAEQRAADLIKDEGVLTEAAKLHNEMGQAEIAFRDDPMRNAAMKAKAHSLQAQFNAVMAQRFKS